MVTQDWTLLHAWSDLLDRMGWDASAWMSRLALAGLVLIGLLGTLQLVAVLRPHARWTIDNVYDVDALRDGFDLLYAEGETTPKMMSIGLHCRLVGRPSPSLSQRIFPPS